MDTRKYRFLEPVLKSVSAKISVKEDDIKAKNERLRDLLDNNLIPTMKEVDPLFKEFFRKLHYMGSFYENLRICNADEFDLNIELKLPKRGVKLSTGSGPPGFGQVACWSDDVKKWVDPNGFLLRNKVYSWLQSVVDRALRRIGDQWSFQVIRKTSGPAVTLDVRYGLNFFSVDLVPVFVFGVDEWPKLPVRQPIFRSSDQAMAWSVVPKPIPPSETYPADTTYWRMSFYDQERHIMNNKNYLKNALKLIKRLRDVEGWHWLASYYIKTVFLWEQQAKDPSFWDRGISVVFMTMMNSLKAFLKEEESIPFFWDKRCNLLMSVHPYEINKIGRRIDRIMRDIDRYIEQPDALSERVAAFFGEDLSNPGRQMGTANEPAPEPDLRGESALQQQTSDWSAFASIVALVGALGGFLLYRNLSNRD